MHTCTHRTAVSPGETITAEGVAGAGVAAEHNVKNSVVITTCIHPQKHVLQPARVFALPKEQIFVMKHIRIWVTPVGGCDKVWRRVLAAWMVVAPHAYEAAVARDHASHV